MGVIAKVVMFSAVLLTVEVTVILQVVLVVAVVLLGEIFYEMFLNGLNIDIFNIIQFTYGFHKI